MVKPAVIEMTVVKKEVYSVLTPRHAGPHGEAPSQSGSRRGRGAMDQSLYRGFHRTDQEGGAEQAGIGLASVNNFSGLWGLGAKPSSLAPDPELTGAEKSGLECRDEKKVVEV